MKDKVILTGKHGRPSTKLAFSKMDSNSLLVQRRSYRGRQYYRVFKDRRILADRIARNIRYLYEMRQPAMSLVDAVVVRWGSREVLPTTEGTIIYNKAAPLGDATNKKRSRELFIQKGVSCPVLVTDTNFRNEYLPIIGRPLVHSKGRNFYILRTEEAFRRHYRAHRHNCYYSNFIDKDAEYRIHCAHGKVLAVMEKPRPNDGNIAWNRAQNEVDPFSYVPWDECDRRELKPVLVEALKSCSALGLDFGGVDVMKQGNNAYVLELNTAPTLNTSPYAAEKWAQYFDWLFRREDRRPHWEEDVLGRERASSMIWKNYQLRDEERRNN